MRVAHVITRLILGGAQENTLLCCEDLLREYGDEVLLITGPAVGPEGSLLERGRRSGIPMRVIAPLRRPIHPWRDAAAYRRIRQTLRQFRPHVVHTHSAKGGMLGRAAAWSLGVPAVVHTVHGAPFHPYQDPATRWLYRCCERWAARRCHAMISVADAMTDLMVEAHVAPRETFITIDSGMEVEPYLDAGRHREQSRAALGYSPEDVVIGKVARLFHLKGHRYVIAAARQVVAEVPNARFLLVGDGRFRDRLRHRIDRAGLSDRFQFVGLVPPDRLPALFAAMDLVVHASLREGLPRVLPQALLAGRPVVSFDIDGAREVVDDETGCLVAPKDVGGLGRALVRLAGDAELRRRLGQGGRRRLAERFDHRRTTAEIRALYARLLGAEPVDPA
ncbi:MAG: glycosyltransferase family 4 protein [Pirellulales bacterium]